MSPKTHGECCEPCWPRSTPTQYAKSTRADMIESVEGGMVGLIGHFRETPEKDPVKAMKSGEVDVAVVDAYRIMRGAGLRPRDTQ